MASAALLCLVPTKLPAAYLGSSLGGAGEHQSVLISAQGSDRSSAHSRGQPCHRRTQNAVQQIEILSLR
jgi:hypothetical protein